MVYFFSVSSRLFVVVGASFTLAANVLGLGVVADFQHKSSFGELHLNLPQNWHAKHCTRHYAKPLLPAGLLVCPLRFNS
jgi:hypothetical protein